MAVLQIQTPEGVVLERKLAGAGSRFAAGLADGLLIVLVYMILTLTLSLVLSVDPTGMSGLLQGVLMVGFPLMLVGYHFAFHVFWGGQTPGKRLLGLRVISADGYPATISQNILRSTIFPLDVMVPVPLPLGLVVVAVTARHQRIGDIVAGTLVVHEERYAERVEPFAGQRYSRLEPRTLDLHAGSLVRLGDGDYEYLRELLTRSHLPSDQRRRLFVESARELSARLELGAFEDARVVLKEIYLFMRESREAQSRA